MNRIVENELNIIEELEDKLEELKKEELLAAIFGEREKVKEIKEQRKELEKIIKELLNGEEK